MRPEIVPWLTAQTPNEHRLCAKPRPRPWGGQSPVCRGQAQGTHKDMRQGPSIGAQPEWPGSSWACRPPPECMGLSGWAGFGARTLHSRRPRNVMVRIGRGSFLKSSIFIWKRKDTYPSSWLPEVVKAIEWMLVRKTKKGTKTIK